MYLKFLTIIVIVAGIFAMGSWDIPTPLANTVIFAGVVMGLVIITKEKGLSGIQIPVILWAIAIALYLYGLSSIDESEGFEALNRLGYAFIVAVIAIITTVVLMFTGSKKVS